MGSNTINNEKKIIDIDDFEHFKNALLEFIVRASKENATPEEIAALPEVAKVWLEARRINPGCIPHR